MIRWGLSHIGDLITVYLASGKSISRSQYAFGTLNVAGDNPVSGYNVVLVTSSFGDKIVTGENPSKVIC